VPYCTYSDLLYASTAYPICRSCGSGNLSRTTREVILKRRELQPPVKHESTLREKCLERETESKRIDKLRSLLLRKRAEVSLPEQSERNLDAGNIPKIAHPLGV
jgi:hypothetical protein